VQAVSPLPEVSEAPESSLIGLRRRLVWLDTHLATPSREALDQDEKEQQALWTPTQVAAPRTAAWLELPDDDPEVFARKTLDLADFLRARRDSHALEVAAPLPESWSAAELQLLEERAKAWLAGSTSSPESTPNELHPLLPHELVETQRPGFNALIDGLVRRLAPGRPELDTPSYPSF
jgi:NOL1/NOP2/fmu family ribosome biogenesis protein